MPFVLDASVTISWALDDEFNSLVAKSLERSRTDDVLVPTLWWYEVRNALVINERRGRLTEADTEFFLQKLSMLRIKVNFQHEQSTLLALSRRYKLTVYDSAYLELAARENLSLATLDVRLVRAARAEKIALLHVAEGV